MSDESIVSTLQDLGDGDQPSFAPTNPAVNSSWSLIC